VRVPGSPQQAPGRSVRAARLGLLFVNELFRSVSTSNGSYPKVAVRLRFRNDWRRLSYHDPDVVFVEDDTYPLIARTWRQANATLRIVRRGWPGFTYHASANAVGTLVAISVAYLVSLAGGLVNAVPAAIVASLVAVAAAVVAMIYRLLRSNCSGRELRSLSTRNRAASSRQ
jgi:hypothetical protein